VVGVVESVIAGKECSSREGREDSGESDEVGLRLQPFVWGG